MHWLLLSLALLVLLSACGSAPDTRDSGRADTDAGCDCCHGNASRRCIASRTNRNTRPNESTRADSADTYASPDRYTSTTGADALA